MKHIPEPEWIVNDMGELGVKVGNRFFFLYKGESLEYGAPEIGDVRDGVVIHEDGTPVLWRIVGKREFGETCWPVAWIKRGYADDRYTLDLVWREGLSFGKPEDGRWQPLPAPRAK
ncbi:hypothetical protein [Paraburkholderia sp. MM6662-R1]|uniref:hypothetical protein n=1 Tax=Paraburkholderia sp. MM6662-R1 TaxID=2991066 RepID=UPI003D1E401B